MIIITTVILQKIEYTLLILDNKIISVMKQNSLLVSIY